MWCVTTFNEMEENIMGNCHNSIYCILPPDVLEHMANSDNPKVRKIAVDNIAAAAEARTMRAVIPVEATAAGLATTGKKHRLIYDMKNKPQSLLPGKLVRSENEPKTNDQAVDEAYTNSGYTYDFYNKIFSRNSIDGKGMALKSSVHVGLNYNNAFWNGQQMAYGDGDGIIFNRFTKSLDVAGHELTHGVVSHTSRLVYQDEPGALNEHLADVFGILIKQWKKKQTAKQSKWLIGEDIIVPGPKRVALRSMKEPGTAYENDPEMGSDNQRAHVKNKYTGTRDYGGVHWNSGIPNHAFYLAAVNIGGYAWDKIGLVWYQLMLDLNPFSQFIDAVNKSIQIAGGKEFGGNGNNVQKAITKAWKDVGF